jgi:hypothetical protein
LEGNILKAHLLIIRYYHFLRIKMSEKKILKLQPDEEEKTGLLGGQGTNTYFLMVGC